MECDYQVWVECPTCRKAWQADCDETWDGYETGVDMRNDHCTNPDCDGEHGNRGVEINAESLERYTT